MQRQPENEVQLTSLDVNKMKIFNHSQVMLQAPSDRRKFRDRDVKLNFAVCTLSFKC
jgi:hypothetical protein